MNFFNFFTEEDDRLFEEEQQRNNQTGGKSFDTQLEEAAEMVLHNPEILEKFGFKIVKKSWVQSDNNLSRRLPPDRTGQTWKEKREMVNGLTHDKLRESAKDRASMGQKPFAMALISKGMSTSEIALLSGLSMRTIQRYKLKEKNK